MCLAPTCRVCDGRPVERGRKCADKHTRMVLLEEQEEPGALGPASVSTGKTKTRRPPVNGSGDPVSRGAAIKGHKGKKGTIKNRK